MGWLGCNKAILATVVHIQWSHFHIEFQKRANWHDAALESEKPNLDNCLELEIFELEHVHQSKFFHEEQPDGHYFHESNSVHDFQFEEQFQMISTNTSSNWIHFSEYFRLHISSPMHTNIGNPLGLNLEYIDENSQTWRIMEWKMNLQPPNHFPFPREEFTLHHSDVNGELTHNSTHGKSKTLRSPMK